MGVKEFIDWENYIEFMDRQLSIWGQPCSVFTPTNQTNLGYENVNYDEIKKLDTDIVLGNKYQRYESRIWINFTISKSTFYKHNWFPEDGEELCSAFVKSDSPIKENDYVVTAIPEATSIWGTLIFVVVKIIDIGLGNVLKREYFLKPTNNADLKKELGF